MATRMQFTSTKRLWNLEKKKQIYSKQKRKRKLDKFVSSFRKKSEGKMQQQREKKCVSVENI